MISPYDSFNAFQTLVLCEKKFGTKELVFPKKAMVLIWNYLCSDNTFLVKAKKPDLCLHLVTLYDPYTNKFQSKVSKTIFQEDGVRLNGYTITKISKNEWIRIGGIYKDQEGSWLHRLAGTKIIHYASGAFEMIEGAPLNVKRHAHASVMLRNGHVMVCGGQQHGGHSAEVYSPAEKVWREVGPLHIGRLRHACCLLSNNKVLIVGGMGSNNQRLLDTCEYYDPETEKFTMAPRLPFQVARHTLAPLNGGAQVLCCGGTSSRTYGVMIELIKSIVSNRTLAAVFDTQLETWSVVDSMNKERIQPTARPIDCDKIMVFSKVYERTQLDLHKFFNDKSREIFDLKSGKWTICAEELPPIT